MKTSRFVLPFFCIAFSMLSMHSAEPNLNIVFIPKSSDQDFWVFMRNGVDRAIKEAGNVTLTWRGPRYNDDTDSQISILQAYTRTGVDAIIIAPTDRVRLEEPVRKAVQAGIQVVVVDSALDGRLHRCFVTTDNYEAGRSAAEKLSELMGSRGNVVLFRTVAGSASTDDRAKGFIDYLKENSPMMKIVSDIYGGGSRGKAMQSAIKLLDTGIKFEGIFAVNESSSDGLLRALRGAGLAGKYKIIGFDSTDFLLECLESGELHGLILQNPFQMGYLSLKAAIAAVQGSALGDPEIFTETVLVTRENAGDPEIKALLVP